MNRTVEMIAEKPRARTFAILTAALAASCHGSRAPQGITVRESMAGDTTVYTSAGVPDTVTVDSVTTVWQSDSLDQPTSMVLDGDRLVVGDRTRVHILTLAGGRATKALTVGRQGDGPGEYRFIYAVGTFGPDTVAVYDAAALRLTWLSPGGKLLGSARVTPHGSYVNPGLEPQLVPWRGGFLVGATANVTLGAPVVHALVWTDVEADSSTVVQTWTTPAFVDLGTHIMGPRMMFGPQSLAALSPGPMLASGDGLAYCVTLTDLTGKAPPRRLCRERPRTPVGDGIRHPDLTVLKKGSIQLRIAESVVAHEEVPDLLPSYDRLRLGSSGELWVRTMGPEVADQLPIIARARPDLGPKRRFWDVFDTHDGRLIHTLSIPASFDPRVVTADRVYGFSKLPTGEIVIGAFSL